MQFEINLIAKEHQAQGKPMRTAVAGEPPSEVAAPLEVLAMRRNVRESTDVLAKALVSGDPVGLLVALTSSMRTTAGACVQLGIEPSVKDFIYAARELIEDARIPFDKGLHIKEWDQVLIGVAMIELICAGIAYTLNMPYVEAFKIMHEQSGPVVDTQHMHERMRAALRTAGYDVPEPEAANDGGEHGHQS